MTLIHDSLSGGYFTAKIAVFLLFYKLNLS